MESSVSDYNAFVVADSSFHAAILAATHNEFFQQMIATVAGAIRLFLGVTGQAYAARVNSLPAPRAVFDAIRNHDSPVARPATESVLGRALQDIQASFGSPDVRDIHPSLAWNPPKP